MLLLTVFARVTPAFGPFVPLFALFYGALLYTQRLDAFPGCLDVQQQNLFFLFTANLSVNLLF